MKTKISIISVVVAILAAISAQADCRPAAPENLAAYQPQTLPGEVGIQALRVVVVWGDVKTERYYRIERSLLTEWGWSEFAWLTDVPRDATSWTDWQPWGTTIYRVTALGKCGGRSSSFLFVPPSAATAPTGIQ